MMDLFQFHLKMYRIIGKLYLHLEGTDTNTDSGKKCQNEKVEYSYGVI